MNEEFTPEEHSAAVASFSTSLASQGRLIDLVMHLTALEDSMGAVSPEIDQELQRAVQEALRGTAEKVDSVGFVIDEYVDRIGALSGEIEAHQSGKLKRMIAERERLQKDLDRLRDYCLACIVALGMKDGKYQKLKGETCTFQADKLAPSCEVVDESLVPNEFKSMTISYSASVVGFGEANVRREPYANTITGYLLPAIGCKFEYSIDKKVLLAALKALCATCKGEGDLPANSMGEFIPCPKCNGKGTTLIPGARLVTGRASLKLK